MKATLVERTEKHAVVRLSPSWLGRLLGKVDTVCELMWHSENGRRGWVSMGSRRWLDDIRHSGHIKYALDHAPVVPLPKAGARLRLVVDNESKHGKASE